MKTKGNFMASMKPIGKYIIVDKIKEEITTDFGLVLSAEETEKIRYKKAKVIAAGTDVTVIKKDDVLYFDSARAHTLMLQDMPYTILSESDVVVVL